MTFFSLALALIPCASPQLPADGFQLAPPDFLRCLDGSPLDVGAGYGHAGPLVLDMDGEAPLDLLVGDLRGSLHVYLGRATDEGVRYEAMGALQHEGEPIRVHNW